MSTTNEPAFQNVQNNAIPFQTDNSPKFCRIPPRANMKRQSPARELLQENNSLLSSRMNSSHLTPTVVPRLANNSKCRERKGAGAPVIISIYKDGEILHRGGQGSPEKSTQSSTRPPLANQSFTRENQLRCQAPMKVRKNSGAAEHRSALLPTGSTGKLIERSRQKVAEKHASRIHTERETAAGQQDQLLSMIEVTKSNLYNDQQVIRRYMNKHKKTIDTLEQKHYDKSIEHRKI